MLTSLIRAEQERLQREGRLPGACQIDVALGPLAGGDFDALAVDEDGLGFDSLARLDLVSTVNRFFDLSATGIEDYLLVHRKLGDWVALIGQHFEMLDSPAWIGFTSSGSTGTPQTTKMRLAALQSEVSAHLTGPLAEWNGERILCPLPVHHIYGFLWGVLLPAHAGAVTLDLPSGLPDPVFRCAEPGDLVLSTPFAWELMANSGAQLPKGVIGVSSGGPTTKATWGAARQLGLTQLIEVYGASETAGIGWRVDSDTPFRLFDDIESSSGGLRRAAAGVEQIPLQDKLHWCGPRQFHVLGRKDRAVQVGGVNVHLEEVRQHLLALDGIADAAVRSDGLRLKAFIVPTEAASLTALEGKLRNHLQALPAPARPDRFRFGPSLPRSTMGKLLDWQDVSDPTDLPISSAC